MIDPAQHRTGDRVLRRIAKSVADWWRAATLLRAASADETGKVAAALRPARAEPTTSLSDLEVFVREVCGPDAVLRKVAKLNDHEFDLIVEVARETRSIAVRRDGRQWKARDS